MQLFLISKGELIRIPFEKYENGKVYLELVSITSSITNSRVNSYFDSSPVREVTVSALAKAVVYRNSQTYPVADFGTIKFDGIVANLTEKIKCIQSILENNSEITLSEKESILNLELEDE